MSEKVESNAGLGADWGAELALSALLEVSGEDAADFLQGQFCNDLALINSVSDNVLEACEQTGSDSRNGATQNGATQISGYCSPKGRLLALFRIFRLESPDGPVYRLVMPASVIDPVQRRLSMFVLRAKVKISRPENAPTLLGLNAKTLPQALIKHLGLGQGGGQGSGKDNSLSDAEAGAIAGNRLLPPNQFVHSNGLSILGVPSGLPSRLPSGLAESAPSTAQCHTTQHRQLIVIDAAQVDSLLAELSAELEMQPEARWELGEIDAGVPTITAATTDKLIPQMVNLQAVDGLSFKKGCYPGQEIVARMQYLGKLKRRMYRLQLDSTHRPPAGAVVVAGDDQDAGTVVRAALNENGKTTLLAVLKIACEDAELRIEGLADAQVSLLDLPYELTS